jgi:signal transduction histidine kinase
MVITLLHSYRNAVRIDDKHKLEWILWGFCASPVPFLLLIKFPQLFGITAGLIDEEITTVFLLLIPFACAVSLVRYTVADIRIVINRSIVYAFLSLIAGVIYFLTVLLAATSLDPERTFRDFFLVGSIIIAVSLLLNPIRKKIQQLLDELLFPARVTFRRTVSDIRERLRLCLSAEDVFQTVTERLPKTISLSSLRMYKYSTNGLQLLSSTNGFAHDAIPLRDEERRLFEQNALFALSSAISFRRGDILLDHAVLTRLFDCTVCVPLCSESGDLLAIAAANPSATSGRLTEEEMDLMLTIFKDAARELERLSVQKRIFLQQQETARLNELNTLKSFFVSSVSHELRTPLTSIRMFAEILRMQRTLSPKKRREYLQIIEGESDRLTRLVENVLDFAAIERGGKEYHFDQINVSDVVRRAVKTMQYQFKKQGARLNVEIPKHTLLLYADSDALEEVCINLLSNALKYSTKKSSVRIRAVKEPNGLRLEVSDNGIGIPKKEIDHIFEHFYRVRDPRLRHAGGTGLGLALVKHIVEAHDGTIAVKSIVGKGTTFTIRFPLSQKGIA